MDNEKRRRYNARQKAQRRAEERGQERGQERGHADNVRADTGPTTQQPQGIDGVVTLPSAPERGGRSVTPASPSDDRIRVELRARRGDLVAAAAESMHRARIDRVNAAEDVRAAGWPDDDPDFAAMVDQRMDAVRAWRAEVGDAPTRRDVALRRIAALREAVKYVGTGTKPPQRLLDAMNPEPRMAPRQPRLQLVDPDPDR